MSTPPNPGPPSPQIPTPPHSGWQVQTTPPVDPQLEATRLRERLRLFLVLLLGLVITTQLALPFRLGGILLALAGGWTGIRLIVMMARRRGPNLGARGWIMVLGGLGLVAVLLLTLLAEAAFYPVVSDEERCIAGANTQTARTACTRATNDRLDRLVRRIEKSPASS